MKLEFSAADRRLLLVAKRIARVLVVLWVAYVLSYAAISPFGAYAPGIWGLARGGGWRVKSYVWAPPGTYDPKTGKWFWLSSFYSPLMALNNRFWHEPCLPDPGVPQHPAVFPSLN
jgi:hypothetical protein